MADFASIRFQPSRPLLRELSADRLNSILTEIKRNKPKGERGITVRQDGTGTYIGLAAALKGGGAAALTTRQPWDLIASPDPEADPEDPNPPYLITVHPGTLNGILSVNWDESFPANSEDLYYAKAIITTDAQAITGVSIEINTTAPSAQQPQEFAIDTEIEYLFGLFAQGQKYRVIGDGHITLAPEQWLVLSASPAAQPGESPYDIFYRLQ